MVLASYFFLNTFYAFTSQNISSYPFMTGVVWEPRFMFKMPTLMRMHDHGADRVAMVPRGLMVSYSCIVVISPTHTVYHVCGLQLRCSYLPHQNHSQNPCVCHFQKLSQPIASFVRSNKYKYVICIPSYPVIWKTAHNYKHYSYMYTIYFCSRKTLSR